MGQTQTVFLPPWVPTTEAEKLHEEEFRDAIVKLSAAAANLIAPHPLHDDPEFCFDWVEHRPFAEAAYRGDKRLHRLLPKLVPKRISEEEFWRNYFSHVFAVKRRYELGGDGAPPSVAPPTASTAADASAIASAADMAVETPATPASPSRLGMTVSYPEKFHLALKYAAEGPPLPNLSDADRILLEALQQQATIGECNQPRPGMWDSAEDKVRADNELGGNFADHLWAARACCMPAVTAVAPSWQARIVSPTVRRSLSHSPPLASFGTVFVCATGKIRGVEEAWHDEPG